MEKKLRDYLIVGGVSAAAILASWWVFSISPAAAADLGGNCCADLEERIAELEATTARKGNRKVSLEITGQINEALLLADTKGLGGKSDAYVVSNGSDPSVIAFRGEARISQDWKAGYTLEIGVGKTNADVSLRRRSVSFDGISTDRDLYVRQSYTFVSGPVGSLSVGLRNNSSYGITNLNTANTLVASKMLTTQPVGGIKVSAGPLSVAIPLEPFDGYQDDVVRYDSLPMAGFRVSASWSSASQGYDLALTWEGKNDVFRAVAGIAYEQNDDDPISASLQSLLPHTQVESKKILGSASVMHIPTGLFVSGSAGQIDTVYTGKTLAWELQGGVEGKYLTQLGKTTLFLSYADWNDADLKFYEGGVVQNFENAGLDLYATVRQYDLGNDNATTFLTGARVKF